MTVEGFFDDRGADRLQLEPSVHLIGGLADLSAYAKQHAINVIFIALPIRHLKRVLDLLDDLRDTTASIYYVPDIFVFDLIQARSSELNGIPVVAMCETPFYGYRGVTKRLTDVILSLAVLVLALPLFALVALLVRLSSPGPVIFRQRRYGLDGREIIVYKFRTMTVTEDGHEVRQASKTDSRVTRIGAFLRRSSIDEIPQLINVLQGRMSLVGPRPHAVAHNEQYRKLIKGYMVRHKVLPGITGLAQVNGCRGETSNLEDMEARVKFDLDYLRHWSPTLDLKILILTVLEIIPRRQGVLRAAAELAVNGPEIVPVATEVPRGRPDSRILRRSGQRAPRQRPMGNTETKWFAIETAALNAIIQAIDFMRFRANNAACRTSRTRNIPRNTPTGISRRSRSPMTFIQRVADQPVAENPGEYKVAGVRASTPTVSSASRRIRRCEGTSASRICRDGQHQVVDAQG